MTEDELILAVAKVIDPVACSMRPAHYGLETMEEFKATVAYGAIVLAMKRARAVIALVRAHVDTVNARGEIK